MRNMTQKQLGKLIGCSEAHICYIEKGKRRLQPILKEKIEKVLEISLDEVKNIKKQYKYYKIFASSLDAKYRHLSIVKALNPLEAYALVTDFYKNNKCNGVEHTPYDINLIE